MVGSLEVNAPEVTINRQPAMVIRLPLRGKGWLATTACCKPNVHSRPSCRDRRRPHRDRRDLRHRLGQGHKR